MPFVTMEGIRLVMDYILPLAITERKHRLSPGRDWRSDLSHKLHLSVTKRNTRTVYIDLVAGWKRVGVFDITGFPTVCGKIADSLELFDECRQYVENRGCELGKLDEPDEPYIRSQYEIHIPGTTSIPTDESPMNLLTAYYIPLFIAEFGPLERSERIGERSNGRIAIEITGSRDACACPPRSFGGCGRHDPKPSVIMMPEGDPIDRPFAISSLLVTEIHDDLLSQPEECCDELFARGYRFSINGDTCYIRRADFVWIPRDGLVTDTE